LVVAGSWPAAADEALDGRVSPRTGFAPSDVIIQAYIEPSHLNRSVSFVVDSGDFYANSIVELDGDRAPRIKEVRFRMLPAGAYEVSVTLLGTNGERGRVVRSVELW
jgi:hypothetical protein